MRYFHNWTFEIVYERLFVFAAGTPDFDRGVLIVVF